MIKWRVVWVALVLVGMECPVWAVDPPVDTVTGKVVGSGEIAISLNVNYRLAYRDNTWVPVDVFVDNNAYDVDGVVEVRTYSGDVMQSPIYRVSAQCPKSSRKRFRLHCFMKQTTRVEAMVYDKGRPVQTVWPWLDISPVKKEDLLGLVLDDNPTDYSFLNMTLYAGSNDQRRFFCEDLGNARMDMLADYEQCYTPYDVIIMGDIEPERIQERHRNLLSRYVREGGTLILCTGENAQNYRHSWVEALAGVTIGATQTVAEADLAKAVFSEEDQKGLKPVQMEVQLADLQAVIPDAARWKNSGEGDRVLAVRRTLGRGQVVTLAVDAASKVLQDTAGFNRLWRNLCTYRRDRGDLNYQAANALFMEQYPGVCGIRLYSKASVMTYLLLYFAIAIVGNWLVFSWLKRRELAWLVLVVCAVGFTAYAMIFGTAGRAKAARLDQLEVLRVPRSGLASTSTNEADPKGGELGTVRSMISLITARSTQQTFKLSRDYSLAEDVSVINVNYGYARGGNYGNRQNRPFYLQEDIPSRIDQFVVGASELRLTQVLADIPVSGGFEGTLECDPARMRGTLVNTTGLEIERPVIWYNNQMYRARVAGKTITMEDGPPYSPVPDSNQSRGNYWGYMSAQPETRTSPDADEIQRRILYDRYLNTLFVSTDTIYFNGQYQPGGMGPGGTRRMDSGIDIPPVLVAWAKTGPLGTLAPDKSIAMQGGATIIVADIDVHWNGSVRRIWYEVPVTITNTAASNPAGQATGRRPISSGNIYPFVNGQGPEVDIVLPPEILKRNPGNVVIKVSGNGAFLFQFLPKDKGPEWTAAHPGSEEVSSFNQGNYGVPERSVCYDLADWRSYTDLATGKLSGKITTKEHEVNTNSPVAITAKVLADEPENKNEDWILWQ